MRVRGLAGEVGVPGVADQGGKSDAGGDLGWSRQVAHALAPGLEADHVGPCRWSGTLRYCRRHSRRHFNQRLRDNPQVLFTSQALRFRLRELGTMVGDGKRRPLQLLLGGSAYMSPELRQTLPNQGRPTDPPISHHELGRRHLLARRRRGPLDG